METIIDKFGRVLIPKKMRKEIGLDPGDKVILEVKDNEITIKELKKGERTLGKDKGVLIISEDFDIIPPGFEEYVG